MFQKLGARCYRVTISRPLLLVHCPASLCFSVPLCPVQHRDISPISMGRLLWEENKGLRQIIPLTDILLSNYCQNAQCFWVTWAFCHLSPAWELASTVHSNSCDRVQERDQSRIPVICQTNCFWWWSCL